MRNAVVLFSGGQDSTICLFFALQQYDKVYTLGFNYGQQHQAELKCRISILNNFGKKYPNLMSDTILDVRSFGSIAKSNLTCQSGNANSFVVPGRNVMFLTYAASFAYLHECNHIVTGVCEMDYQGFPDCRRATMDATQTCLSLALDYPIEIITPLIHLTKAEEWKLADELGGKEFIDFLVKETHTCYKGNHEDLHEWGYGCGECLACRLRADGYKEYVSNRLSK